MKVTLLIQVPKNGKMLCNGKILLLNGNNTVQAQQLIANDYLDSALSYTTICRWYEDCKRGRKDINDMERSGWANEAVTQENV